MVAYITLNTHVSLSLTTVDESKALNIGKRRDNISWLWWRWKVSMIFEEDDEWEEGEDEEWEEEEW